MIRVGLLTLGVVLFLTGVAQAQASSPSLAAGEEPVEKEMTSAPADGEAKTDGKKTDDKKSDGENAEEKGFSRKGFSSQWGLGAGMLWLPDRTAIDDARHPAIAVGLRSIFGASGQIAMEWVTDIIVHDFEAMGDAYGWYNEGDEDTVRLKYVALWPGLLFIPFAASNYATGFGVIGWTSPEVPAVFFDGGLQLLLFLRPSDPVHKVDFGGQLYAGAGLDFTESLGMSYRFSWAPPALMSIFQTYDEHIMQMSLLITFTDWD